MPDAESARLWEALEGTSSAPDSTDRVYGPDKTESAWRELGAVAFVGRDGGFHVDIEPGEYWICFGFDADDVNALSLDGCAWGQLTPGDIQINLVAGGVHLGA